MAKTVRIEEIGGCEGNCITINDTRVAGPKPWGGGYVIKRWDARVDHILQALGVDVAEVVRCKDCTRRKKGYCTIRKDSWGATLLVGDHDFCSDAERREEV